MICISCGGGMAALELADMEVDRCFGCGGMWLDSGELAMLAEGVSEDSFTLLKDSKEKSRRCPMCRKTMKKVVEPVSGAKLDRCAEGCGTWFDGGELHAVLAAFRQGASHSHVVRALQEIFKNSHIKGEGDKA